MRKQLLSLSGVFIIMLWAVSVSAETITLVADEWPPFNGKPGTEKEGYMVDIAREIFEARGYPVEYNLIPWKRAIHGTRAGTYTGAIGASKTDAEGFIFPAEELARNFLAFYVKKGHPWKLRDYSSVQEITLGVIGGYDYRVWLNEYIQANKDDQSKVQILTGDIPLARNLQKLLKDRIDAVVDTEAAIRSVAKELGILDQIEPAGYGQEPAYCYIAFSPNNQNSQKYADILSEGIITMRESGRLQAILDKYGLNDWK